MRKGLVSQQEVLKEIKAVCWGGGSAIPTPDQEAWVRLVLGEFGSEGERGVGKHGQFDQ